MPLIIKAEKEITSVEAWYRLAPPRGGERQWVDGHSAKELAKAWFPTPGSAQVPGELEQLLSGNEDTCGSVIIVGWPEETIKLADFRGNTRNADLVLLAERQDERVLLTIEAKARESFSDRIGKKLDTAPEKSNIPERIDNLCLALFGDTPSDKPGLRDLRYQLLHAVAATLIVAKAHQAKRAVFVVHEFVPREAVARGRRGNHNDLVAFVGVLSQGRVNSLNAGSLVGPFDVPGYQTVPSGIPLYVGKISRAMA